MVLLSHFLYTLFQSFGTHKGLIFVRFFRFICFLNGQRYPKKLVAKLPNYRHKKKIKKISKYLSSGNRFPYPDSCLTTGFTTVVRNNRHRKVSATRLQKNLKFVTNRNFMFLLGIRTHVLKNFVKSLICNVHIDLGTAAVH